MNPSRRSVLSAAPAAPLALAPAAARAGAPRAAPPVPSNPLVVQRADAQILRHDGRYYMTASVPEYDRLVIRSAPTLAGLSNAEEAVVWRRPLSGPLGGYIWAPELHRIDGRWFLYFAAGDKDQPFRIRTYVLRCVGPDPIAGRWTMEGKLQTPWDSFTLDSTVFTHKGRRYLAWAQGEPGIETNSNLYLAPLATPTTLAAAPCRLTVPTLPWEVRGFKVAEGPAPLHRNGRLFMAYSASATDARYCLGLLTAEEDADLMDSRSWSKSPEPVFVSNAQTRVFGPGHNSFTTDEQGRDLLVYHGRSYEQIDGDPLFDPNRHTRVQRLYYRPDGAPDFGVPVGEGPLPDRLSPLNRPDDFLAFADEGVTVGAAPLPNTQWRRRPAGDGYERLEPILQPGRFLTRGKDGALTVAPIRNPFPSAWRVREGRGGALSFEVPDGPGQALTAAAGRLAIGSASDASAFWRVT
jgi:GH43 family beta-xylosidase